MRGPRWSLDVLVGSTLLLGTVRDLLVDDKHLPQKHLMPDQLPGPQERARSMTRITELVPAIDPAALRTFPLGLMAGSLRLTCRPSNPTRLLSPLPVEKR